MEQLYRWVKWSEKIPDNWEDKINRQTTTGIVLNNSDWTHKNDRLNEYSDNAHCDFIFYQDLEWLSPIEDSKQDEGFQDIQTILRDYINDKYDHRIPDEVFKELSSKYLLIKR